ncbi:MAG: TolC family protein [Alloprevotella sp.]|nr:TolC family protein [Alloprevotella sp.]
MITCAAAATAAAQTPAGADTIALTLDETIARARSLSVDAAVALGELRSAYWEYRSYRADLLPEVVLSATAPSYSKQYSSYMNEEGNYSFVSTNNLQATGKLDLRQTIWATGGTLSLSSQIDFLRQFSGTTYNRWMSIPVALTLEQPIFAANAAKWNRRIEPVRYREAKAEYMSASEAVAMTAINYYFSLLLAREEVATARQNLENAEMLYAVAKEKRAMGQISKNDLLQMELNLLNARSSLTSGQSNERAQMFRLRAFLDYGDDVELVPSVPSDAPDVTVDYPDVLDKALSRNKLAANLRRRQLEADYEVAKAKGNMRSITLRASVGYTGTDHTFSNAYRDLLDNQVVEVGISIPLIDWGKRRGRVKVAESNREVVQARLRQERQTFSQDLFVLVERFSNQREQLAIAERADTIAARRYDTNVETYLIGRISTLDLNDSQTSKDDARRTYITELFNYWYYYYQLRSLTLWDFVAGRPLEEDFTRALAQ